jgi:hypothetical protein
MWGGRIKKKVKEKNVKKSVAQFLRKGQTRKIKPDHHLLTTNDTAKSKRETQKTKRNFATIYCHSQNHHALQNTSTGISQTFRPQIKNRRKGRQKKQPPKNTEKMVSVSNPNTTSKNRVAAREAKARKIRNQRVKAAQTKISQADARLGAKPGLLPTSGPRARVSKKKLRKIERGAKHALKRRLEAEGEVLMSGKLLKFFYLFLLFL